MAFRKPRAADDFEVVLRNVTTEFGLVLDGVPTGQVVGTERIDKPGLSHDEAYAYARDNQRAWDEFARGGAVFTPQYGIRRKGGAVDWLQVRATGHPEQGHG